MEISLQELEDSQLLPSGQDFEPSSIARSSLTAPSCSKSDGPMCPISETSEQLTFWHGEDESMFSQEASPVSRSVLPASSEAKMMTETSGRQCAMLSSKSGLFGSFVKTCLESSAWANSSEFVWIWKTSVTKHNRLLFQLTPLEQSTEDKGSLLWPTACANCSTGAETQGQDGGLNLQTAAKLWPTPRTADASGGGQVARDPEHAQKIHKRDKLRDAAKLWPTPTMQDGANNCGPSQLERNSLSLNATVGGSLNPRFVEELMGFPIDHTACERSETPSVRSRFTRSSVPSPKSSVGVIIEFDFKRLL